MLIFLSVLFSKFKFKYVVSFLLYILFAVIFILLSCSVAYDGEVVLKMYIVDIRNKPIHITKIFFDFSINANIFFEVFKHFIPLFFIGTLCLFLSTVINNSVLCVGITISICLLSSVIAQILFIFNISVIQYTFLPYIDFNVLRDSLYLNELKNSYSIYLSINKGIIVLVFHILLFICLSINSFTKKDIKN